jgi:hypothetical protein
MGLLLSCNLWAQGSFQRYEDCRQGFLGLYQSKAGHLLFVRKSEQCARCLWIESFRSLGKSCTKKLYPSPHTNFHGLLPTKSAFYCEAKELSYMALYHMGQNAMPYLSQFLLSGPLEKSTPVKKFGLLLKAKLLDSDTLRWEKTVDFAVDERLSLKLFGKKLPDLPASVAKKAPNHYTKQEAIEQYKRLLAHPQLDAPQVLQKFNQAHNCSPPLALQ